MTVGRICIYPCGGIKKVEATVARIAAYIVNEDLMPGKTMIMCVPALLRGVEEDILMMERNPTIIIDCHEESCASHLMYLVGIKPAVRIYMPEIMMETGLRPGKNRQELDKEGSQLALVVAEKVANIGRWLLKDKDYTFKECKVKNKRITLCEPFDDIERAMEYIKISPGVYRPKSMPPIIGEEISGNKE
jgi:uncharacterized metal-binding protein